MLGDLLEYNQYFRADSYHPGRKLAEEVRQEKGNIHFCINSDNYK